MARYRIVQKPYPLDCTIPVYEVQERWLIFWQKCSYMLTSIEEAEETVWRLLGQNPREPVKTKVVKEYY